MSDFFFIVLIFSFKASKRDLPKSQNFTFSDKLKNQLIVLQAEFNLQLYASFKNSQDTVVKKMKIQMNEDEMSGVINLDAEDNADGPSISMKQSEKPEKTQSLAANKSDDEDQDKVDRYLVELTKKSEEVDRIMEKYGYNDDSSDEDI